MQTLITFAFAAFLVFAVWVIDGKETAFRLLPIALAIWIVVTGVDLAIQRFKGK